MDFWPECRKKTHRMMSPYLIKPEAKGLGMTSQRARDRMVDRLRSEGGIRDERVLNALRVLPRHLFIEEALASRAYEDTALPIAKAKPFHSLGW